ncbi:3-hydroxyacyl-CoA dehydrogenase NAD-binding domain-containing protein [Acidaminococcus timonensis]|uniref:3-hydroxyacyl-CoA dehydrogenase NAD-binding domain-containing protein n=1 Tax=Acidaminococcus timonensis TaxID=1871002 RepID=UPI0025E32A88|nr:3-hydroxyacyl-CoA dehydrogenase NAD-binding domain-containing protein [Acidaminococcus timonensis]
MEYWDIYDVNKQVTGRKMKRNDWHMQPGDYHLTVLALVCDETGRILITQRKADKEWAALKWEIPGGGVRAGETSQQAVLREVAEETGLHFTADQAQLIHTYRSDSPAEQNNYFVDIYRFQAPFTEKDVTIQADEVESFKLATPDEIRALGAQDDFLHFKRLENLLPGAIRTITIAGAGTMGYSMADIFAQQGYEVTLWNHRQPTLDKAKTKISAGAADKITYTTSLDAFKGRDLIVESIVEDLPAKLAFYKEMSPLTDAHTLIATNTSGLSINKLAEAVTGPDRFLGMHWFNPPTLIPLIEIIKNDKTRPEVAKAIYDLSLAIGKKPVVVEQDVPGFAANRIQLAVLREALSLVQKGVVSVEGIDAVMKYGLGFRWACLGPLETIDFGGLDVFEHISEYLMPDLEDSHDVPPLLAEKVKAGNLGVKTGAGFYDYSGDRAQKATAARDEKFRAVYEALYGEKK